MGYVGGELVGYYWWVDRRIDPATATSTATGSGSSWRRDVYGFDFFLLEEHRGGGNSVEFLHKVEKRLRDRGYGTLWGYVVAGNKPARWLYSMRGYSRCAGWPPAGLLGRRLAVGAGRSRSGKPAGRALRCRQ